MKYSDLLESFKENPRDVHTVPKQGIPKWFYTFVKCNTIYVKSANSHNNTCNIQIPRTLNPKECEEVFSLYQQRDTKSISKQVQSITRNASYWFGIFEDYDKRSKEHEK